MSRSYRNHRGSRSRDQHDRPYVNDYDPGYGYEQQDAYNDAVYLLYDAAVEGNQAYEAGNQAYEDAVVGTQAYDDAAAGSQPWLGQGQPDAFQDEYGGLIVPGLVYPSHAGGRCPTCGASDDEPHDCPGFALPVERDGTLSDHSSSKHSSSKHSSSKHSSTKQSSTSAKQSSSKHGSSKHSSSKRSSTRDSSSKPSSSRHFSPKDLTSKQNPTIRESELEGGDISSSQTPRPSRTSGVLRGGHDQSLHSSFSEESPAEGFKQQDATERQPYDDNDTSARGYAQMVAGLGSAYQKSPQDTASRAAIVPPPRPGNLQLRPKPSAADYSDSKTDPSTTPSDSFLSRSPPTSVSKGSEDRDTWSRQPVLTQAKSCKCKGTCPCRGTCPCPDGADTCGGQDEAKVMGRESGGQG